LSGGKQSTTRKGNTKKSTAINTSYITTPLECRKSSIEGNILISSRTVQVKDSVVSSKFFIARLVKSQELKARVPCDQDGYWIQWEEGDSKVDKVYFVSKSQIDKDSLEYCLMDTYDDETWINDPWKSSSKKSSQSKSTKEVSKAAAVGIPVLTSPSAVNREATFPSMMLPPPPPLQLSIAASASAPGITPEQWSHKEIDILFRAVDAMGITPNTWDMISKVVFDGKYPADRCMLCWQQTAESIVDASVQWSHNDVEALLDAVRTLGPYAWNKISSDVFDGRKTAVQCMFRWREVDQSKSSLPTAGTLVRPKHMPQVKETTAAPPQFDLGREEKNMNASSAASLVVHAPINQAPVAASAGAGQVKGPWSEVEHKQFMDATRQHGWGNWEEVQQSIPSRNGNQVKSHAQKFAEVSLFLVMIG